MRAADYFLPRGQVLQWHGQAGQCLQVCEGLIVLEELLWVEEQLLQPRQRLGPGSCYVLHSSGWVTLTALGDAQLRLPACLPPAAPAQWWATGLARLRRVADKLGGRWLRHIPWAWGFSAQPVLGRRRSQRPASWRALSSKGVNSRSDV